MTDLLELAKRCEAATGPDRELDADIWTAVLGNEQYWSLHDRGGDVCLRYYPGPPGPEYHALKRYTASLDAALTLVPEGWIVATFRQWIVGDRPRRLSWQADLSNIEGPGYVYSGAPSDELKPATGPLALCAAALRARADQSS